ncbi:proteoglycan 4-like [Uranotaenia lowii]|uniref:proteoglycan 4-like n=1 Tax=Uranotaenia lowii TaxID=190385 RepID=UPI0024787FD1|nr:proteoglycan 4-like [Uranotaenia lowii]
MTVLDSNVGGNGGPMQASPPPPPPPMQSNGGATTNGSIGKITSAAKEGGSAPSTQLLMSDIRNGVTLKPTKTKDKSTAAFIRQANKNDGGNRNVPQPQEASNGSTGQSEDIKDALQQELRNTLKRKVKKDDIESGDSNKQSEIEKSMEQNRTVIELKVNSPVNKSPSDKSPAARDVVDKAPLKSSQTERQLEIKSPVIGKGLSSSIKSPVLGRSIVGNSPLKGSMAASKPLESPKMEEKIKKVPPGKPLTIDVSVCQNEGHLKNSILSPEVKSGTASIRPSQIKTLTQSGGYVSHTDIVENPKPVQKSPISLVEQPKPTYSPPTPKTPLKTTISNGYNTLPKSPRTPAPINSAPSSPRTLILDTKFGNIPKSPLNNTPARLDPNAAPKKLLISHPKASFTLPRSINKAKTAPSTPYQEETKPVFRILTDLEAAERQEPVVRSNGTIPAVNERKLSAPKADQPGAEPILTSFVSFSKEMSKAPNNYPDTVRTKTTVGVRKEDLFMGNTNLRDVKFDIVENGKLRIVNK